MSNIGFRIFPPNRAPKDLVELYRDVPSPNVSDNMSRINGVCAEIRPMHGSTQGASGSGSNPSGFPTVGTIRSSTLSHRVWNTNITSTSLLYPDVSQPASLPEIAF